MNIPVSKRSIRDLTSAAICLTLCIVLPFLTGQIPKIGSTLSPMHIPVLLGGFLCGPWWAMAVGFIAPLLRFALFGMPPLFPTGLAMSFELATYGLISGLLYARSSRRTSSIYASLVTAMLAGRMIWGCAMVVLMGLSGSAFTWVAFVAGAFTNAVPGIIIHLIFIPGLVVSLQKSNLLQGPEPQDHAVLRRIALSK